jgi:hypothetical protein
MDLQDAPATLCNVKSPMLHVTDEKRRAGNGLPREAPPYYCIAYQSTGRVGGGLQPSSSPAFSQSVIGPVTDSSAPIYFVGYSNFLPKASLASS